jgi:hypothetical protein
VVDLSLTQTNEHSSQVAQAPAKVASPSTISYVVANPNAGQQMDDYAAGTLGAQMDDGTVQQQQQQYANPLPVQKANGAEMVLPPEPTPISAAGILFTEKSP